MTEESIKSYYDSYSLDFQCLDREEVLYLADARLTDHQCRNLVIDFGADNAYVAWDIDPSQATAVKASWANIEKASGNFSTRWIAIFDAHEQRGLVNTLLRDYGISARTRASLTSPLGKGNLEIVRKMWHWSSIEYDEKFVILGINSLHNIAQPVHGISSRDLNHEVIETLTEKASANSWFKKLFRSCDRGEQTDELPLTSPIEHLDLSARQTSVPRLPVTDSKRHRMSQYAQKKLQRESHGEAASKGYSLDQADDIFDNEDDFNNDYYHPRMLRLWIWLIKLDDNTIITLHEPFPPFRPEDATYDKIRNTTGNVRRNMRTILRCLSAAGMPKDVDGTDVYSAELAMENGALVVRQTPEQAPGLLFYYLFDDWYSTWGLTVDRAHPYTNALSAIKNQNPQLHHINSLHDIVRRLSNFKRIYQSYELVLSRLLEENKHLKSAPEKKLGPLALSKFARLKHRITYLAIGEIVECEREAEGLISLTYNRLNFREVQAVEKLSLLSVTLVKFTIMFLPLSLITAFFSMDVEGISGKYNSAHFWGASGVAVALTTIFLLCVGKLNKIMLGTKKARMSEKRGLDGGSHASGARLAS